MTTSATSLSAPALSGEFTEQQASELQEQLKRCSPETFRAACLFRKTGDAAHLRTVVLGIIERYVERELRPKLNPPDDGLRLVEDLGLDSLTLMEIVLLAEDVLKVSVSNEELTQLRTVGDVCRFITAKLSPKA